MVSGSQGGFYVGSEDGDVRHDVPDGVVRRQPLVVHTVGVQQTFQGFIRGPQDSVG